MKRPLKSDARYTITREHGGWPEKAPRHVLRFCGEFISSSPFYASMLIRAAGHKAERNGALVIEGIPNK